MQPRTFGNLNPSTMNPAEPTIPVRAARLIIQYLHNTLTESETKEFDDWMGFSDENQEPFEQLTESMDDSVLNADQLLIETEEAIDFWVSASDRNKMTYGKLQEAASSSRRNCRIGNPSKNFSGFSYLDVPTLSISTIW